MLFSLTVIALIASVIMWACLTVERISSTRGAGYDYHKFYGRDEDESDS
jgi:hypothetical protein